MGKLEREVTEAELKGLNVPSAILDHPDSQLAGHDDVISTSQPLLVFRSEAGGASGGTTLIYREKVGEMDRLVRFRFAKNAFCIEATDDLMRPAHRTRDTLIIDPDKSCAAEDDCVFVKDPLANPLDTVVRCLVRIKTEYELDRAEYTKAWPIITVVRR